MTVKVLGPLDTGTQPLSPRERAIFSALIVRRGSAMAPAELAEACWGESTPATWGQQVKSSVALIRTRLGRDTVVTVGSEYASGIEPDVIDAVRFERLVSSARQHSLHGEQDRAVDIYGRALALWRGTAYPDLADWEPGIAESLRLAEIRRSAEEELLEARLRAGDHRAVIAEAERLVREEPLREDRWAILALANYQTDRQAEALAVVRAAREQLLEELGIEPGPRLTWLETAMLRQDPALAPEIPEEVGSGACPYRGLAAFGPDDAEDFFGRDADIDELLRRVEKGAVVAIAGPSGSGKSSLMLAGVIPRLRDRDRRLETIRPNATDLASVRRLVDPDHPLDVLAIDQAEELLAADPDSLETFCRVVAEFVERGGILILTVRSDFLDRAAALPGIGSAIGRGVYLLGPLTRGAMRDAIVEPARRAGLRLEPGLVEVVLRDAADRPSTLPPLSHALVETWVRREGSTLTVEGYEAAGGIAGAIAQSAEDLYQRLEDEGREICRSIMLRLVERTADGSTVRRRASAAPLLASPARRRVIEGLVAARLVAIDGDAILIAHESVAGAWPRLDGWLADDAEGTRILRAVENAAGAWDAAGRPDDDLLRGPRLHAALDWRASGTTDLTAVELDFLDRSTALEVDEISRVEKQAARERRQNGRLRWALAGAGGLLVVAMVSGSFAIVRGNEAADAAEEAQLEALAATSLSLLPTDRDAAALLAVEAYHRHPGDARARAALMATMSAPETAATKIVFDDDRRISGAPIPGTRTVLVIEDPLSDPTVDGEERGGSTVSVWDADTGEKIRDVDADVPVAMAQMFRRLIISDDGRTALSVQHEYYPPNDASETPCCSSVVTLFDVATGAVLPGSQQLEIDTSGFTGFDASGRYALLLAAQYGELIRIDTQTGETLTQAPSGWFEQPEGAEDVISVTPLPDGRVAVGQIDRIDVYDAASLMPAASVHLGADLARFVLKDDGTGALLASGPDGIARIDLTTGALLWQKEPAPSRLCVEMVPTPVRGTFLCQTADGTAEFTLENGDPTGRVFDPQTEWIQNTQAMDGGRDLIIVNQRSRPTVVRFPLDGSGPASTLAGPDLVALDGFGSGGDLIVVAPRAAIEDGSWSGQTLWDVHTGETIGEPSDGMMWLGDDVIERYTVDDDGESSTLVNVSTGDSYRIHGEGIPAEVSEMYPMAGAMGPLAFAVTRDAILPFDPHTGETTGTVIDFTGRDLLGGWWLTIAEAPGGEEVVISWWDIHEKQMITAVFDLATGEEVHRGLIGDTASIATPTGDVISVNSSALRRSTRELEPKGSLPKPVDGSLFFSMSDDGSTLLLSAPVEDAALYDLDADVRLGPPIRASSAEGAVNSAFLHPDGRSLVVNSDEGILLWDLDPGSHVAAACRMVGRELTAAEWSTYFGDEEQTPTCG